MPNDLFPAATAAGRLADLDLLCRSLGLSRAANHQGPLPNLLFVNAEPGAAGGMKHDDDMLRLLFDAKLPFRIVVEFTERDLAAQPGALLRYADKIRTLGHLVAIDDVGDDPAALALVPLLKPEIVKLDLSVVQRTPSATRMICGSALAAYAEQTGAILLAEGVETEAHMRHAAAWGADWVQGYLYGRPGPIPIGGYSPVTGEERRPPRIDLSETTNSYQRSLFEVAAETGRIRRFTREHLIASLAQLETHALRLGQSAVVLMRRPHVSDLLDEDRDRCHALSAVTALLAVSTSGDLGELGAVVVPGNPRNRHRAGEWATVVFAPHWAVACVAHPVEGGYDAVLTFDPSLVQRIGRQLGSELDGPCDAERRARIDALASSA
jgi:EAL domain-containing protein (putative c-di-GMP-specific phosphodiesterase class I)